MLDAVREQRPVREVGHRIVEGLVRELILERLALAHVAAVQDDAPDVLVLQQVGVLHLELEPGAVPVLEGALDHMGLGSAADVRLTDAGEDLRQAWTVGLAEQPGEVVAFDLLDSVAEDALHGWALVRDRAVGVEDGDQVARMGHQRAEPCFALPPVQVLGKRRSLDCEGDLRGQ